MEHLTFVLLACLFVRANLEEKRWAWQDKKHKSNIARYDVVEDEIPDFHDDFLEYSPTHQRPGGVYGLKPKPGGYGLVNHPYRPGGIIAGPEPTWSRPVPLKNYDKCKCTEKFNCPTPGISYGHCDTGKSYCCYVSNQQHHQGADLPVNPVHSAANGILVGPGGPTIDYQTKPPLRPIYNRPGGGYGVLSGPTGGRPSYYPQHGLGTPYSPGIRPRSTE